MPVSDRDKRTLKIGGIIVGVAVVGLILFNVLSGGGGEQAGQTPRRTATPTPTVTPSPGGTPNVPPVAQFGGRDPFSTPPEFLVAPPSGGGTSSSPGGSPTSSGGGTGSSPPPTQPGGGSSANLGGHSVVLLDVFTRNGVGHAQVEVDGVVYTVTVGESFGPGNRFALRSVSGNCGTFVFGDESFALCITPSK